jgi:hypothetical protein
VKSTVLIFFGLSLSILSFSQGELVKIESTVSVFSVDTIYSQIDLHYSNVSDGSLVLWFEIENIDSLAASEIINNHFHTVKEDWSLMQMIWDGNISSFTPELFESFLKIIDPKGQFSITIMKKGKVNFEDIYLIQKHIMVTKTKDVRGLKVDERIKNFTFKADHISLLGEWLELNK